MLTHPYTMFDNEDNDPLIHPNGGKWEEVTNSEEYGMVVNLKKDDDMYLEWSVDQSMYLDVLLQNFGPEGAGVTWTPIEIMIRFKFVARDPTNGHMLTDEVNLVVMSN
jgi:hypothetical protein